MGRCNLTKDAKQKIGGNGLRLLRERPYTVFPVDKDAKYQGVILAREAGLRATPQGQKVPGDRVHEYLVERAGAHVLPKGAVVLVRVQP